MADAPKTKKKTNRRVSVKKKPTQPSEFPTVLKTDDYPSAATMFEDIIEYLRGQYNLKLDRSEHPMIAEFYEDKAPLFKLIYNPPEDDSPALIIISFQIDQSAPVAVQWFVRIQQLFPKLCISASYIKDASGVSYVGEDAEIVRLYAIEQHVISNWMQSENEEVPQLQTESSEPDKTKVFYDKTAALMEFRKMGKSKKNQSH